MAVVAYHAIITNYGFWLPNDPRGSWSDFVRKWELLLYGEATKVTVAHSVAHLPHNRRLRYAAKEVLDFPPVRFSDEQIQALGWGFARYIEKSGITFQS